MHQTTTITPSTQMSGALDVEPWLAAVPAEATVKGLFPARTAQHLGEKDFERLAPRMLKPPRQNRFLPFGDYPVRDAMRLGITAAARTHPGLPLREAFRRYERGNLATFAASVSGGVMLSLAGGVEGALLKVPAGLALMSHFGSAQATKVGRGVLLEFRGKPSWIDTSAIGILEGIALHFNVAPTLELTLLSPHDADYLVSWR